MKIRKLNEGALLNEENGTFYVTTYTETSVSGPEEGGYTSYGWEAVRSKPFSSREEAVAHQQEWIGEDEILSDNGNGRIHAIDDYGDHYLVAIETDETRGSEHSPALSWAEAESGEEHGKPFFDEEGKPLAEDPAVTAKREEDKRALKSEFEKALAKTTNDKEATEVWFDDRFTSIRKECSKLFTDKILSFKTTQNEAMTIAYDENTIKRMISKLEKEIEDYKVLMIEEPEDKDFWQKEMEKCQAEIDELKSYKPLDEDYNIKFYQIFKSPEKPTDNGKMVAQCDTEEEAHEKGKKLCGEGKYLIKAVCDDGKTRYLESYHKRSAKTIKIINENVLNEAPSVPFKLPKDMLNNPDSINLKGMATKAVRDKEEADAEAKRQAEYEANAKKYASLIDDVSSIDGAEERLEALHSALVPSRGKADTVAGELVRAMMRILYRDYNDGDVFYEGYGIDTCSGSVAYLIATVDTPKIYDGFSTIAESKYEDTQYTKSLEEICSALVDYILTNKSVWQQNTEDSRSESWEQVYERDYREDWEPTYDYDFMIPPTVAEHMENGNCTDEEFADEIRSELENSNIEYDSVEVWSDYVYIYGLKRDDYDELESRCMYEDSSWDWFIDNLNDQYGDPFADDDEDEDDED